MINELDYDQVGTDGAEYIELKNVGATTVDLDSYTLQFINAGAAGGPASYDTIDLPSFSLVPGGYYVVCANATTVVNCNLDDAPNTDFIQNGNPDAVGLLLSGTLVDVLSYEGNTTGFTEGTGTPNNATGADSNTVANIGLSRFPDGTDTNNNSSDFTIRCITPGTANSSATTGCSAPVAAVNLTVNNVTQAEGNAGATSFTFTVSLSAPAGPGGVTFDISTADGTAQDDNPATEDNDYVAQSLTGQTIPSGSSTFSFTVTVNGDAVAEANETFFVNVSNVVGASVSDGQGLGTINNDEAAVILSINDVTQNEGNAGTTAFTFTVSLDAPAGPGGVTFDIATADGTAQDDNPATEDNDYVAQSLTGQTIPAGSSTYAFNVTVNGNTTTEPNETFFVNVTNIVGAVAGDTQGTGTIVNDDVTITLIHDVQGNGATSPIVGATVTIRGIVTGVKSNGFFVQEEDIEADADPATSEGIFVFTSSAPPAAAAFTARVEVTGTVVEFVPSSDPQQPPVTEITSPTVTQLAAPGQPLPTPVPLTATFPNPAGPYDQLERVEGMRVSAASITAVAPSDGNINESNNTGTSNGRFFGVVTGVARPFREPGIRQPDTPPSGSIPPIPRWDSNPELLGIESAAINSQPILTVKTGDTVAPVVGPLDYGFRRYAIYPDGTNPITVVPGTLPTTVTAPTAQEFTVASWNVFHLYDTVNVTGSGPGSGDVVVTAQTYADRLNKASIAIRNNLRFPDIVGLQEVENLTVLQDLATKINNDAVANAQPNPMYVAYLSEGNDIGGIDVGFLVKTAPVTGGLPRVAVNSVTQIGATTTWIDPDDNNPALLNDRPSLVLDAVINRGPGSSFPIIVINNHLRSLIGIDSNAPDGITTEGNRVRLKRKTQAEFLANYVQSRLTANPNEHIVLVGDFNAFEFNDGYVDVINTITGTPPPDNQTVVPGDGVDLVNPDLVNLVNTPPPSERYSYIFDGNAQNLDHIIVSAGLVADTTSRRVEHPRIGADYPETERSNAASPLRTSDHDPVLGYFAALGLLGADVSVTKTDNVDPVNAGQNFFYTVNVTNAGPDAAANVSFSDTLPAGTTFVSLSQPGGWTCSTPAVGANGTVTCSIASLGAGSAAFNITVAVNAALAAGTVLSNSVTVSSTTGDPNPANNTDTETTTVATSSDLSIAKTDTPDPVDAGSNLTYQLTVTNNGPSIADGVTLADTLPAGTTFVSLTAPAGWTCTTPAVGGTGSVTCNIPSLGVTAGVLTLVVNVNSSTPAGTVLSNTATISATTPDPNGGNNSATATTLVAATADLSITKTDSPDPVTAGTALTYTITVNNAGPSSATSVQIADTIPANTTFQSLTAPAGWTCTTPAVGGTGAVSCTNPSVAIGAQVLTLTVTVGASVPNGTVITSTATVTSTTTDPNAANNSATVSTTVGTGSADLSVTKTDSPDPVTAGGNLTYTINVTNAGPSNASSVVLTDAVPANTTFVSFTAPAGWTCTTPAAGATGNVTCNNPSLAAGTASFTLVVNVNPSTADGTLLSNTATVTSATTDPTPADQSDTETTTVAAIADLSLTNTDSPDPVVAGTTLTYTLTVTNAGPSTATAVQLNDAVPANTTFQSFAAPAGWTCSTPAVGGTGPITCTNPSVPIGSQTFTLTVTVGPSTPNGTTIANNAVVNSATTDPNITNNLATALTGVGAGSADLSVTKTDTPDPVAAGSNITYTINVVNAGPSNATTVVLTDAVPANTTFVSLTSAAGWTCTTPAAGATGSISCSNPSLAAGTSSFTLVVAVNAGVAANTTITNTAAVTSATVDPVAGNETDTETTTVVSPANVSGTKTASGSSIAGGTVTYTITLTNAGPQSQGDNPGDELVDVLPSQLTLVSASASSGVALANVATNTVTWNGSIAVGTSVTITIQATVNPTVPPGTSISNQGTIRYDANGDGTNEATRLTDDPSQPGTADPTVISAGVANIPTLSPLMLAGLAVLLAAAGMLLVRSS